MGVAHHGSYAAWLEIARTELLRTLGTSYRSFEGDGMFLVITQLSIRYRRPIRYDDVVRVEVRVAGGTRTRIDHEYDIRLIAREGSDVGRMRDVGEDLLSIASTTLACVDRAGRVQALPGWLATPSVGDAPP